MNPNPTTERWKNAVEKFNKRRDESAHQVDEYFPPLKDSNHWGQLPNPLPRNVTSIPKTMLDKFDYEIVQTDPMELLNLIASGKYSSMQVVAAYLRAAIIGHRLVNLATGFLPKQAYERAKYLDDYLKEHKETIGPLHGLPISLKEMIGLKGLDCNSAFVKYIDKIVDEDAHIVDVLRDNGAIFYLRTTQPQAIMHIEGDSNLHGATANPSNRHLTSGGSTAGEGASLALKCSPLGIGTDIGGSIRWPASANGQYGLRPTTGRVPIKGVQFGMSGASAILSSIGPLSRTLEGAIMILKLSVDSKPWLKDSTFLNGAKWDNDPLKGMKQIRIGIESDDGVVTPHPPVQRAIREVQEKLEQVKQVDGFELVLVPYKPYKHDHCWDIISSLYFEDGAEEILKEINDGEEPVMPLTKWLIQDNPNVKPLGVKGLWEWNTEKNNYKYEYLEQWNKQGIDALIAPVGPGCAAEHGNSKYWNYTSQWNLLDYPSITFPVTKVDADKDKPDPNYTPKNEKDKFNYELYTSAEKFADAPVGLQLVATRSEDEKMLSIMRLIDKALKA